MTLKGRFGDPQTEKDIVSAKRFNFFALIVLIIVCAMAFLFYMELMQKKKELETKSMELADSTAILRKTRSELEAAQVALSRREEKVEKQLIKLTDQVEKKNFVAAVQTANDYSAQISKQDSSPAIWINFYAWKPDVSKLSLMRTYLLRQNFTLVKDEIVEERQKWLGNESAVYFYNPQMEKLAHEIASNLSQKSGTKFMIKEGRHQDIPSTPGVNWFHIHYLGETFSKNVK